MLVLGWVLATGCSSQEQPGQLPPTDVSGAGGSAGSGGIAAVDAGSGPIDTSICATDPIRLLSQRDDAAVYACSFPLTIPLNDYDPIRVFEDASLETQIPADSINGWMYSDPHTILLTGGYCEDALAGKIVALYVLFNCPYHPTP